MASSVLEVIAAVKRVSGRELPVEIAAQRPGDPLALVADVTRIRAVLDWQPRFADLDVGDHALGQLKGYRSIPMINAPQRRVARASSSA